jgi:hypothetical protein
MDELAGRPSSAESEAKKPKRIGGNPAAKNQTVSPY